jgi:hypothetical protein
VFNLVTRGPHLKKLPNWLCVCHFPAQDRRTGTFFTSASAQKPHRTVKLSDTGQSDKKCIIVISTVPAAGKLEFEHRNPIAEEIRKVDATSISATQTPGNVSAHPQFGNCNQRRQK